MNAVAGGELVYVFAVYVMRADEIALEGLERSERRTKRGPERLAVGCLHELQLGVMLCGGQSIERVFAQRRFVLLAAAQIEQGARRDHAQPAAQRTASRVLGDARRPILPADE